jgi:hypothetical protein
MAARRSILRFRPLLVVALLVGTACGSNAEPDAAPTTSAVDEQPVAADTDVPEALRFRASRVGGGEIDMSTLAGKPVVMWFWAPY